MRGVLVMSNDRYEMLAYALFDAFKQASMGKGKDRHDEGQPFEEQPIMWIEERFKSFQLGQAVKKIHESQGLPTMERKIAELHGAINFIAAHIIYLRRKEKP